MTDKQIIKQLAERYKAICRSPFADGYTFTIFDGECAKKGFTRDDIKNYIEKEKQERKTKRTKNIKSLKEQLKAKEQECEELKESNIGLNKDWEEKKNLAYEIACKNDKLKQTLTEIKTIALTPICVMRIAEREEFGDAEWSELRGKTIIARQILQIISEYEEKENE